VTPLAELCAVCWFTAGVISGVILTLGVLSIISSRRW
jgi:hypothetical protein